MRVGEKERKRHMKKVAAVFLTVILAASLAGCKSEEAKNADALIDAIGEITLDSDSAITAAEEAVEDLSDEDRADVDTEKLSQARADYERLVLEDEAARVDEAINAIGKVEYSDKCRSLIDKAEKAYNESSSEARELITGHDTLIAAEEAYHRLDVQHKAQAIEAQIDALGEVTLESESEVIKAANVYASADDDVKKAVTNYDVLTAAQDTVNRLKVQAVTDELNALSSITLENGEDAIKRAKALYNALPDELKSQVTNYGKIAEAEQKLQDLRDQRYKKLIEKMDVTTDKVSGITIYNHPILPELSKGSVVLPFVGYSNSGGAVCAISATYRGKDWIFFDEVIFSVDGKNTTIAVDYFDVDRHILIGGVSESAVLFPDNFQIELLRSIVNSSEPIIRLQGDSGRKDIILTAKEKKAFGEVLELYDYMADGD